jgi:phage gp46-like protein
MFSDYKIDPTTGDYVIVKGDLSLSNDMMNNLYFSISIRKGSWFYDPSFGSNLHLLKPKAVADLPVRAKEYCEEALQWLIDSGRADKIDVQTEVDQSYETPRLIFNITAWQHGKPQTYTIFKEVR